MCKREKVPKPGQIRMFLAHFRAETPQMAHFTSWRFERRALEGISHRRGKRHDVATEESPFQDRNEKLAGHKCIWKPSNEAFNAD